MGRKRKPYCPGVSNEPCGVYKTTGNTGYRISEVTNNIIFQSLCKECDAKRLLHGRLDTLTPEKLAKTYDEHMRNAYNVDDFANDKFGPDWYHQATTQSEAGTND